jgi:hypothetical protein
MGLVYCLSIFQGYIYSWNIFAHVFYCSILLDVVKCPHIVLFVREILVHVIFFTSTTFNWWYFPFSQGVLPLGFILSRIIFILCIRNVSVERRFESLASLIRFILLLILPRLLQRLFSISLIIQVLILSNGLCQSSGIIILDIIFIVLVLSDPCGYRWPPIFSNWLKTVFWQFW